MSMIDQMKAEPPWKIARELWNEIDNDPMWQYIHPDVRWKLMVWYDKASNKLMDAASKYEREWYQRVHERKEEVPF